MNSKDLIQFSIRSFSFFEQESVNISQNVAWGKRKAYADGKVTIAFKNFLGYEKGSDGKIRIVEEEAKIIRRIYNEFLMGYPIEYIRRRLVKDGIPTPMGKTGWCSSVVKSILTNEKYIGDAILQKTFSVDVLTKKKKKNEGELPQYYVENNHPAIISREMFEMVREELERRKENGQMVFVSHFSGRIQCGDCGGYYGRKVWHSNTPYQCYHWRCNKKFDGKHICNTPTIKEQSIEECFIKAFNELYTRKDEILENYRLCLDVICDDSAFTKRKEELEILCQNKVEIIKDYLFKCSKSPDDMEQVNKQYDTLIEELETLQNELQECNRNIAMLMAKRSKINSFIHALEHSAHVLTEFDAEVWQVAVNKMVIYHDLTVKFVWRDGSETMTTIERGVKEVKTGYKRPKQEPVLSDRVCKYCGKPLYDIPGYVKKQFCDSKCRKKWVKQEGVKTSYECEDGQGNQE